MARNGPDRLVRRWQLIGVDWKWLVDGQTDAIDPNRTLGLAGQSARNGHRVSRSGRDRVFASRIEHGAYLTGEWPICHGVSRRFNERGESGIRNILKPAISGN